MIIFGLLFPLPSQAIGPNLASAQCKNGYIRKNLEALNKLSKELSLDYKIEKKNLKKIKSDCLNCKDVSWTRSDELALKGLNSVIGGVISYFAGSLFVKCVGLIALGGATVFGSPVLALGFILLSSFGFFWVSSNTAQFSYDMIDEISSELKATSRINKTNKEDLQMRMSNEYISPLDGSSLNIELAQWNGYKFNEEPKSCNQNSSKSNKHEIERLISETSLLPGKLKKEMLDEEKKYLKFLKEWHSKNISNANMKSDSINSEKLKKDFISDLQSFVHDIYEKKLDDLNLEYSEIERMNRTKGENTLKKIKNLYENKRKELTQHEREEALIIFDFLWGIDDSNLSHEEKIKNWNDFNNKAEALVKYRFATARKEMNQILSQSVEIAYKKYEYLCIELSQKESNSIVSGSDSSYHQYDEHNAR